MVGPREQAYVLTEEEKKVLLECDRESLLYRAGPLAILSMVVTRGLISRGVLSVSPTFGSLPKMAFAGVCGYMAGKISYIKTCQEKFRNLKDSPLGEALRLGRGHSPYPQFVPQNQPESGPQDQAAFDLAYEETFREGSGSSGVPESYSSYSYGDSSSYDSDYRGVPFSSALSESAPSGAADDDSGALRAFPVPSEDEGPKKRTLRYEELRSRNRENYEVVLNQKAEAAVRPHPEKAAPPKEVKTNIYGDAWEE
ncbi:OCIA domain-containing protein 1-like [Scleropages formosus]|uniref:OCIA domain-containing protein 1 n=1 Tax=Scleropages formosus TaxID=113540 RepID=A0A0N8JV41_SCLFO|nr:OCIA domain-containing protein 1-like [Scleropages formosus]